MSRPRCAHDESERRVAPSRGCRACDRERQAARRALRDRPYSEPRPAGDHPDRPLSLDVATDPTTGVVREPRRTPRASTRGGQTIEGGGSPRGWVICRCSLCAASRVTFSGGTERRQDGERDRQHPVYYRRHPAIISTREEVVVDAEGADRRVAVTTTDYPQRWTLIEETATRGNAQRPPVHPATAA